MRLEPVLRELPAGFGLLRADIIAILESGSVEHVKENALALSLTMTPDDLHELDAACPRPSR